MRVLPGLPSLKCYQKKWKMKKYVSANRGISYPAHLSRFSPTNTGAPPLVQTWKNPRQRCEFWYQWWRQYVGPINPESSRHPVSQIFHYPDGSPSLICYSPDIFGVWHINILRWRIFDIYVGVRHALCFDAWWPGLFCSS